jgi:hypothetical protein
MPAKREKTDKTAEYFGLAKNFLRAGATNGTLQGTFFRIGSRGDYIWDWELLETRLKELCRANVRQDQEPEQQYGKLRKIQ